MSIEILMPALSPTMTDGNLTKWLVSEGQKVKAGDVIAEIETDKATMEVEAVDEGFIKKLLYKEGDYNIPVNKPIALISDQNVERIKEISNLDLKIVKSWVNEDSGRKEDICYHTHSSDYSCVYYIKTLPYFNSGTLFKEYGFVRAKQNSLILFPSNLIHGTPSYPFSFIKRYTLAVDMIRQVD